MTVTEIVGIVTTTISDNFMGIMAIIAVGAGVKIVLDIIFKSLYNITQSR